ncbi:MAG TPA: gliding motility-associated C-terminal domain-containing protein, partial [Bacteroidia bacterium]|nr:gliding motility-associated C-terminal domain-containing protein [Bacteroidia bacterium]
LVETSSTFYVPNAITPGNKDGKNDMFLPVYAEIETKNYDMKIFDRWGNLVFHTTDIKKGWDGKYNDNKLQEDSYVYSIKYSDLKQNEHKVIGFVNVIR